MSTSSEDDAAQPERATDPARSVFVADDEQRPLDIKLVDMPGLIALWGLAAIVFLQFFTRYVLNDSLAWTEEIARYVLILVTFLGAVTVSRKGTHIFLEFFYRFIPPRAGKWLSVAMEGLTMAFYGYMAFVGVQLALKTRTKMASADIPKSLVYWGVVAGLAVMALYSLVWLVRKLRQSPRTWCATSRRTPCLTFPTDPGDQPACRSP
ncbi:TRAP transporter small permease [Breoghania sp. L-A4]|uniref:TRAP transporter small permease n=1 Tax=Breoghania sp. L-A4 TaxID=2304600 RepID=UPI000E35AE17|nr:TRAP transporter small permease [Breoghania sp. L-A4]AXS40055.1 TRAP transporter small permease [Breoghania sp. L-A4]